MKVTRVVAASIVLLTASGIAASAQTSRPRVYSPEDQRSFAPPIDLWLDQVTYDRGERIRPYFATEPGAYVTIVRVTTDGTLRVLYPLRPAAQQPYRLGQLTNDRVPHGFDPAFSLYESRGTGIVFAIASYGRFDYSAFTSGGQWSTARLASYGSYGDPFEIVQRFIDRTLSDRAEFSMDYVAYEVYSRTNRSRYATRYVYSSLNDYYDRCLNAFGYRYDYYCQGYDGYYGRHYGPVVFVAPRRPSRTNPAQREPKIRPLVPDPMVTGGPVRQPAEGRFPSTDRNEAAAAARQERLLRSATPRTNPRTEPTIERGSFDRARGAERRESEPIIYRSAPRPEPRSEPRVETRSEPRYQPRIETRSEPRHQPPPQARVQTRSEPRPQPPRSENPRTKDKQQ